MRIPTLGALTLAAAAAVVAVPTTATAAAPSAVADTAQASFETDKVINVLANDTNPDSGESLSVTGKTNGAHGTVSCTTAGACTYSPALNWRGTDTFTYTLSDGGATPETATGTVTVETGVFQISISSSPANLVATDLARNPSHKITGVVTGSGSVPIAGIKVQLYSRTTNAPGVDPAPVANGLAISDSLGKIEVAGLKPTRKTWYSWKSVAGKRSALEKSVTVTPFLTTNWTKKVSGGFALGGSFTPSVTAGPVSQGQDVVLERRDTTAPDGWAEVQRTQFPAPLTDNSATVAFSKITPVESSKTIYRVVVPASNELGREQATSGQQAVSVYDATVTNVETSLRGDEFVTVKNTGVVTFNLLGWKLQGDANSVTLPKRSVAPNGIVKIHTGKGTNTSKDLYLGKAKTVSLWPRTGSVTLVDTDNVALKKFTF